MIVNSPLVSVCIPTYCGEKYFRECIESVLGQTFSDFEVLVVDDCSTDYTLDIANQYAKQDSRIRVSKNEKNLGLVGNWNRCLELARGTWIKYLFQDDVLAPTCIERMVDVSKSGKELIVCRRDFWFEDDNAAQKIQQKYNANAQRIDDLFAQLLDIPATTYSKYVLQYIGINLIGEPTATMLHRSVFSRFGAFNANLIQMCDHEMWTRVAIHTGITYIPETLATFRVHSVSTTAKNHQTKNYRTNVLDGLIALHDIAFHPMYSPLRSIASEISSLDLNDLLRQRTRSAWLQAAHASDSSLMTEWEATSKAYPILKLLAKPTTSELIKEQLNAKQSSIRSRLSDFKKKIRKLF
jgi:glycosyltransferase involved in cell wall biosynthesis